MKRTLTRTCALLGTMACVGLWLPRDSSAADRRWYVAGGAGICHLDVEESMAYKPDLGFRLVAVGGFQLNRYLGLELDTGFARNTYTRSPNFTQRNVTLNQVPVVVNGIVSWPNATRLEPFGGVGLGLVYVKPSHGEGGGDVSLAFKGGARYGLNERTDLSLDYTFFMLGAASAFIEEAVGLDTGNLAIRWWF